MRLNNLFTHFFFSRYYEVTLPDSGIDYGKLLFILLNLLHSISLRITAQAFSNEFLEGIFSINKIVILSLYFLITV